MKELFEKKAELVAQMRVMIDAATEAKREFTADEDTNYEALESALAEVVSKIEAAQAAQRLAARTEALLTAEASLRTATVDSTPQMRGDDDVVPSGRSLHEHIRDLMSDGLTCAQAVARIAAAPVSLPVRRARAAAYSQFFTRGYVEPSLQRQAALQMNVDAGGGYLIPPEQFVARLIMDLDRRVFVRGLATVIPVGAGASIGVPTLATDIADTVWTTELAVGTADSSMAFGKRRLTPHPLAKYILVSKDLIRSAAIPVDALIRERLGYKFGTVQEAAFMTGSGAGSPLGVFTASSNGISTSQDVSTGNATDAVTTDGLIEAKYKLESQWFGSANLRWVFHRDTIKMIRKLKDGDGQYIWSPGLRDDATDRILNVPVEISEYAPNTFTTGLYVGIIGDFTYYWIVDSMALDIQRLVELGALTNQDYFIGRMALDGAPVLEKAFARVKLA